MMDSQKIKVLICDDSALLRITLKKYIEQEPKISVIGIARNGEEAIEKARSLNPDVITMDFEMPVLDGLSALKIIVEEKLAPVIMFSSHTQEGAQVTMDALEIGAFDFVTKPDMQRNMVDTANQIIQKIMAGHRSNFYKKLHTYQPQTDISPPPAETSKIPEPDKQTQAITEGSEYKAVTIGLSTGGPRSIFNVLPKLPANLGAAVFMVQHMPKDFLTPFIERIDSKTPMNCVETKAGMKVTPGTIYVGQGEFHLKVMKKSNGEVIIRQSKEPKHLFIPSVDIMMDSVCKVFGEKTIGVLMTGMGSDGAAGMVKIKDAGGFTIAESEDTAIVFGMPGSAIRQGGASIVVPNWEIPAEIIKAVATPEQGE